MDDVMSTAFVGWKKKLAEKWWMGVFLTNVLFCTPQNIRQPVRIKHSTAL